MAKQIEKLPEGKKQLLFEMIDAKVYLVENSDFDGVGIYSVSRFNNIVVELSTFWAEDFDTIKFSRGHVERS